MNVKIIEVDGERRRLSLSLKRVEDTDPVQPRADGAESVHTRPAIDLSEEVFAEEAPAPAAEDAPVVDDAPTVDDEPALESPEVDEAPEPVAEAAEVAAPSEADEPDEPVEPVEPTAQAAESSDEE